jgi:hypothetical protein
MNVRYLTVGIGIALIWVGAGYSAESESKKSKTQKVVCSFSATFADGVESHIDTNDDGVSAILDQAISNCNTGRFFITGAAEYQRPLFAPEICPADNFGLELHLQQARGVGTEERTGDQLFVEYGTNGLILCVGSNGTITSTGRGTYAGGTGQFEGASGSFEVRATGKYLVTGEKDGITAGFGQYTGTSEGELTTIRKNPSAAE